MIFLFSWLYMIDRDSISLFLDGFFAFFFFIEILEFLDLFWLLLNLDYDLWAHKLIYTVDGFWPFLIQASSFFLIKTKKHSSRWFLRAIHLLPPVFLLSRVCFILHILHVEAFISQQRWGKVNEIKWAGVFSSNTPCSSPIYPEGLFCWFFLKYRAKVRHH